MTYDQWKTTPPDDEPALRCPRCGDLHDETDFGGLCEPCHAQLVEDGEIEDSDPDPLNVPGPNGCTCGFNGDCNCRFIP